MNGKYKYLIKNVGILTISNFASKVLVFLLVPLYTNVLTTEEYGIYDLAVTTAQLLLPLLTLNISDAVMRFCMDRAVDKSDVIRYGMRYVLLSFIPVSFFVIALRVTGMFESIHGYEYCMLFYYLLYALNQFLLQTAKGNEHVRNLGVAGALGTMIMVLGNIAGLLLLHGGLKMFFVANIASQGVSALYLFFREKVWIYFEKRKIDRQIKHEMLAYAVPLTFTAVSWWVNHAADKYTVTIMIGAAANGLLSVAYKIPTILNTVQQIFIQAWQVSAIKEYKTDDDNGLAFHKIIYSISIAALSVVCSGLILTTRIVARFLYAKDFYAAWQYVPFLLVACIINAASGIIGPILLAQKETKTMARSAIIGSAANIVMNIIGVKFLGIQGATIATMISSFIIYFVRYIYVRNVISVRDFMITFGIWMLLLLQGCTLIYTTRMSWQFIIMLLICVISVLYSLRTINRCRANGVGVNQ